MRYLVLVLLAGIISPAMATTDKDCQGMCGDCNADGQVNISDAVYLISYIFVYGPPPQPVLACGDANGDAASALQDAVWIINYVFVPGSPPPGDCSPGAPGWPEGDCCPYVPGK